LRGKNKFSQLLFYWLYSATLAQNKPEKNDTKTVKQVEQKTNQKDSNATMKAKTNTKSISNLTVSKDKTKGKTKTLHYKKKGTTNKMKLNENKPPVKDDTNNKVK
jgi:hypothetical protein